MLKQVGHAWKQRESHGAQAIVRRFGMERGSDQLSSGVQRFAGLLGQILPRLIEQKSAQFQSAGPHYLIIDRRGLAEKASACGHEAVRLAGGFMEPNGSKIENLLLTRRAETRELAGQKKCKIGGSGVVVTPQVRHVFQRSSRIGADARIGLRQAVEQAGQRYLAQIRHSTHPALPAGF
jgi:hypothetical protein